MKTTLPTAPTRPASTSVRTRREPRACVGDPAPRDPGDASSRVQREEDDPGDERREARVADGGNGERERRLESDDVEGRDDEESRIPRAPGSAGGRRSAAGARPAGSPPATNANALRRRGDERPHRRAGPADAAERARGAAEGTAAIIPPSGTAICRSPSASPRPRRPEHPDEGAEAGDRHDRRAEACDEQGDEQHPMEGANAATDEPRAARAPCPPTRGRRDP